MITTDQIFDGMPVISFDEERERRNFLRCAVVLGVGGTLVAGRFGPSGASAGNAGDVDILNYALTLEYLTEDFYARGLKSEVLSGRDRSLVVPIREHEASHVKAISSVVEKLGAKPVDKPRFSYPKGTFGSRDKFLSTALALEELGVTAYHGQVTRLSKGELLAAAASIAGIESRHAAVLASITGVDPFPAPLERTATMPQVLRKAKPFLEG